jgi:hypothetical protein
MLRDLDILQLAHHILTLFSRDHRFGRACRLFNDGYVEQMMSKFGLKDVHNRQRLTLTLKNQYQLRRAHL